MSQTQRGSDCAWVVGATGFLGRHVAARLSERGYSVVGLTHREVPPDLGESLGFARIESGVFDPSLLGRALRRAGPPAVVFHAIGSGSVGQALADPEGDLERTVGTARTLMEFLCRHAPRARLIYPSSAAVYGIVSAGPISEDAPTQPASVYGKNKLLVEQLGRNRAKSDGLDFVALRFFSVYGAPQRKLLLWDVGQRLLAGKQTITLCGTGEETRDFIDVRDATATVATIAAVDRVPSIVNVGTGRAISIRELTSMYAQTLGKVAEFKFSGVPRPGDPPHHQADVGRLRSLGISGFISLNDGLAAYARWLQSGAA